MFELFILVVGKQTMKAYMDGFSSGVFSHTLDDRVHGTHTHTYNLLFMAIPFIAKCLYKLVTLLTLVHIHTLIQYTIHRWLHTHTPFIDGLCSFIGVPISIAHLAMYAY